MLYSRTHMATVGFKGLSNDDVCPSVCRQLRICEACSVTIKPINVKIKDSVGTMKVDYRMQYYDVITNPRWWTAIVMKIVMLALSQ